MHNELRPDRQTRSKSEGSVGSVGAVPSSIHHSIIAQAEKYGFLWRIPEFVRKFFAALWIQCVLVARAFKNKYNMEDETIVS